MASTPVWPKYVPTGTERTLWYQRSDGGWVNETDGEVHRADTAEAFCDLLFQSNGLAFCGAIETLPWFHEAIAGLSAQLSKAPDSACYRTDVAVHPQNYTPISITFTRRWPDKNGHKREQKRKVVATSVWSMPCGPELIARLRWLFNVLECGAQATPGSAGSMTMQQEWGKHKGEQWPRHHRPPMPLIEALSEHAVGSRKETYAPDEVFQQAYEADMTNGFAAQADVLPAGTVSTFGGTQAHHYLLPLVGNPEARQGAKIRHWWGKCYVRIWGSLPPGDIAPFAVRDKDGELSWPTAESPDGGYWTYLWEFEADEIQRRFTEDGSMQVISIEWAWCWETETTQLAGWADHMDQLRRATEYGTLAGVDDPHEKKNRAGLIKLCIVAGIGRLGMPYESLRVIPEAEAQPGDIELQSERIPDIGLYARKEFNDIGTPKHWHAFILSKMNYDIYCKIREQYLAGIRVLGCNVDGVQTLEAPAGVVEAAVAAMGQYKRKEYTGYFAMPAAGTIISLEAQKTPGLRADVRRQIASGKLFRAGERPPPQSRGELLAEQGKRLFLDEMHRLSKTAVSRREQRLAKEVQECENLRQWYVQRRYWDRIAGNG